MDTPTTVCNICGEPIPEGEQSFDGAHEECWLNIK